MQQKKGLVGKELKPTSSGGGAKPGMAKQAGTAGNAKPPLNAKLPPAKDLPAKTGTSRNLLSVEDVGERLRVDGAHVERWIKEGILKGSLQSGVQLYELEKFRAKHHREIQQAQHAPAAPAPTPAPKAQTPSKSKTGSKKAKVDTPTRPAAKPVEPAAAAQPQEEKKGRFGFHLLKELLYAVFSTQKPEKTAPYVKAAGALGPEAPRNEPVSAAEESRTADPEMEFADEEKAHPSVASISETAIFSASQFKSPSTGELIAPPPPSQEVWPSLERLPSEPGEPPSWLAEQGRESETLILRADQISAVRSAASPHGATPGSAPTNRELQEEKQRNQELLKQLQEQRRAELELQDEIETLKQRLDLSLTSEREVRSQLKRSRQELQTALEELDQRPPAGPSGAEEMRLLQDRCSLLESEKSLIEQQKNSAEQQKAVLESQIERLRAQAEEIRQHGLQWHQLATQQDGQLRALRQQHADLEQEASRALDELEVQLRDAEEARVGAEEAAQEMHEQLQRLNAELERHASGAPDPELQLQLTQKERALQQLQFNMDQLQSQMSVLETQHRNQTQRWEQELQASASWVQKLTEAVTQRDRRISELESLLAKAETRAPAVNEEELKSQVMSLRVELTSLRRNYEIVNLQAKNLENQLQESRRAVAAAPAPPLQVAPSQPPPGPAMLTLDLPMSEGSSGDEEGGFRRRLNARLRSLGTTASEDNSKKGLEPPPFLELEIPES